MRTSGDDGEILGRSRLGLADRFPAFEFSLSFLANLGLVVVHRSGFKNGPMELDSTDERLTPLLPEPLAEA